MLLLDTNAIIHGLQRRLAEPVRALIAQSPAVASSVVIGEMLQGKELLNPQDPRSAANAATIQAAVAALEALPILTPDHQDWRDAMSLLGSLGRCNRLDKPTRAAWLRDSFIYLGARKSGATLVTADLTAFDLFQQALPGGDILFFSPD